MTATAAEDGRRARRTLTSAALALVVVTAVWGSTFALSKDLITRMAVTDYLALRFLTAAAVVALARPRLLLRLDRRLVLVGIGLGLCYFAGQALQFFGLRHTAATVSAFVVSMYVVFAPLLGAVVLRQRPSRLTLVATALATAGVGTMSLRGWALGFGELLTLIAAALYAVHILALGRWTTVRTAYPLTFVQLLTMGVCFVGWASVDGLHGPARGDLLVFFYLAVVAGAVAMLVQTWAQAHVSSAQAAVLMVLEPVWAAFFGFAIWRESLDARTVVGGGLVLLAMLLIVTRPAGSRDVAAAAVAEAAGIGVLLAEEHAAGSNADRGGGYSADHRRREQAVQIDKDQIIAFLQERGQQDKADQAQQELPGKVDTEKDSGLLSKLGIDPADLLGGLGGGVAGKLGL